MKREPKNAHGKSSWKVLGPDPNTDNFTIIICFKASGQAHSLYVNPKTLRTPHTTSSLPALSFVWPKGNEETVLGFIYFPQKLHTTLLGLLLLFCH